MLDVPLNLSFETNEQEKVFEGAIFQRKLERCRQGVGACAYGGYEKFSMYEHHKNTGS